MPIMSFLMVENLANTKEGSSFLEVCPCQLSPWACVSLWVLTLHSMDEETHRSARESSTEQSVWKDPWNVTGPIFYFHLG